MVFSRVQAHAARPDDCRKIPDNQFTPLFCIVYQSFDQILMYIFFFIILFQKTVRTMTYLGREISRRLLPVVTFVLISFLISGKLVRARPQENFVATSHDSNSDGAANSSEIKGK